MKKHSEKFLKLVKDSKKNIKVVGIGEIYKRMEASEDFVLIDVRDESELIGGRIPGATHISRGVLERDIEETFSDLSEEIILYCGGGHRSALAAENLQKMGYYKVFSLEGGFRGWKDAGYPTVEI